MSSTSVTSSIVYLLVVLLLSQIVAPAEIRRPPKYGSCSGAPACGHAMASIDGVPALSNGYDQCTGNCCGGDIATGCAYQCVELAQRFFHLKFGITPIWDVSAAKEMCSNRPSGVHTTNNPTQGDLVVFDFGTWGHVAVIDYIDGDEIHVIEQNGDASGKNTYSTSDSVECYLTANSSAGGCGSLPDGYFCGLDGLNLDANTLYLCKGGAIASKQACSNTCVTMPHGEDDQCDTSGGSCSTVTHTGNYCGGDVVKGGSADILYRCIGSKPDGATYCPNGCQVVSGANDVCKS